MKPFLSINSELARKVFFIALLRVTFGAVENGGGIDIWNVPKSTYSHFIKVSIASKILF